MIRISKRNAIKSLYYILSVDGYVNEKEKEKFNELGLSLDKDEFTNNLAEITAECNAQISKAVVNSEHYDVIQEGLDKLFSKQSPDDELAIPVSLIIWNMLAICHADNVYSEEERKLILHIVRISEMERSVFLEMENLMKTAIMVNRELEWLSSSDRPYSEIRPIVEEAEKRYKVIMQSAIALIEDEAEADVPFEDKKSEFEEKIDSIADDIKKNVDPLMESVKKQADQISKDAAPIIDKTKDTAEKAVNEILSGAGSLFNKIGSDLKKKTKASSNNSDDKVDKEE